MTVMTGDLMFDDWHWFAVSDGDECASALYARHYSCRNPRQRNRKSDKRVCGPGEKLVLITSSCDALFVWRKARYMSGQMGINCAVFRNEGPELSSALILEAEQLAWQKWPGERLYTFVNPHKILSTNPGFCFKKAGWIQCGSTMGGLLIFEKNPLAEDLYKTD